MTPHLHDIVILLLLRQSPFRFPLIFKFSNLNEVESKTLKDRRYGSKYTDIIVIMAYFDKVRPTCWNGSRLFI